MNVFSNVQLNASVLPYTNTTLAKTTNSITVTNFSHLNLSVGSSVTPGYGVMPPFSTQSFAVAPNEQITWQMQEASVQPPTQNGEYVSYTESPLHYASGLQSLAQLPLYAMTVTGNVQVGGSVSINNAPDVTITGAPNVTVSNQQINTIVANQQSQPVPTIPQTYYGTGSDGAFAPSANYTFANTPNEADIKNFTSVNIPSGVTVNWNNSAHYVCWFVQGDVTIGGTIKTPLASVNISNSQPNISLFNGVLTLPKGGAGGNGGGGAGQLVASGGVGGNPSVYGSGMGGSGSGGGGGGQSGYFSYQGPSSGGNGTNGQIPTPASGGSGGYGTYQSGSNCYLSEVSNAGLVVPPTNGAGLFIIVCSGVLTISGEIINNGTPGGAGGAALSVGAGKNSGGGGGGAGGGSQGGGGGGYGGCTYYGYGGGGGGGGGGAGGGVVTLFSGSTVSITGSILVNGGGGGVGGAAGGGAGGNNGGSGQNGFSGQAGSVLIYQYNNQISG